MTNLGNDAMTIRKLVSQTEELRLVAGAHDDGPPLRRVAVAAVVSNPCAGHGYVADLSAIVAASQQIASTIGAEAARLLGQPAQSYGKGGMVGSAGEQEHINAALTSVFGDAFRQAIGGGQAWISSVTKPAIPGAVIDVPLAFKDEVWVRSHYDAIEVRVPDAPQADEMVVIAALANRGRINARVGGLSVAEVVANGARS